MTRGVALKTIPAESVRILPRFRLLTYFVESAVSGFLAVYASDEFYSPGEVIGLPGCPYVLFPSEFRRPSIDSQVASHRRAGLYRRHFTLPAP